MMRIPEPSEGGSKETESRKDITMAKPDERHNELLKIKFSSSGDGGSGRGGWLFHSDPGNWRHSGLCSVPGGIRCTPGQRAYPNDDAAGRTQWRSESTS